MDCWKRFVALSESLEFEMQLPKCHLMAHAILRASFHGNPWKYHTFLDESDNSLLKKALRFCHQSNFEALAFCKFDSFMSRLERFVD